MPCRVLRWNHCLSFPVEVARKIRPNHSRPEYESLLEVLREKYDYVIIDTPPVLVVTDPASVESRVDGVVLAMRLSRHTRDLARRSLEQLRDVGATVTGIVINGVEESEGYGYGSYRYSDYRYSYRSYNYGYGDYGQAKAGYYSDDQSDGSDAECRYQIRMSRSPLHPANAPPRSL